MPESITIPTSIDGAVTALSGLGELITARKWERSAIVAAFVRLDLGRGGRETDKSVGFISPVEFAGYEIVGLSSAVSVRKYVQAWLDAHDDKYPRPGATRRLPTGPFPPMRTGTDGHSSKQGAAETIEEIIDQHGVEPVVEAATRRDAKTTSKVVSKTIAKTLPPPPFTEPPEIYPGAAEDEQRMDVQRDVARIGDNISLLQRWLRVDRTLLEPHADRLEREAERLQMLAAAARGVDDAALASLLDGAE